MCLVEAFVAAANTSEKGRDLRKKLSGTTVARDDLDKYARPLVGDLR
jgi:hypothetical protein